MVFGLLPRNIPRLDPAALSVAQFERFGESQMTVRLWSLLSLVWVSIVGGGLIATHWVETGTLDIPNMPLLVFTDLERLGITYLEAIEISTEDVDIESVNCRDAYRQYISSSGAKSDERLLWDCLDSQRRRSRAWREALVTFLALVFGPPLVTGFLCVAAAAIRKRPQS